MYLAELRLTLALLGYEVGRKRCALTKEELLHLLHDDLLVLAIRCSPGGLEAGQLPAGGFGSTVPRFGQVGDGGPQRPGGTSGRGAGASSPSSFMARCSTYQA